MSNFAPGEIVPAILSNLLELLLNFCNCLAGVPGFEPGNPGIKTRCLTAWPPPNGIHPPVIIFVEPGAATGVLDRCSRRDSTSCIHAVVPLAAFVHPVLQYRDQNPVPYRLATPQ